jgi:hypothetical protein
MALQRNRPPIGPRPGRYSALDAHSNLSSTTKVCRLCRTRLGAYDSLLPVVCVSQAPAKCLICVRRCASCTAYGGVVNETTFARIGQAAGQETKVKKIIALATVAVALAIPATSLAASNQASDSGATHGAFANVNGAFGWLGALGGTPGYHNGSVGQDPGATGYNNSHVNGNVAP